MGSLWPQRPRRAFGQWSPSETEELIKAWEPVYTRRRSGSKDAWVPAHIRGRARCSRALVTEDWRAVAAVVNSYRANTCNLDSWRTHDQCKKRLQYLRSQYMKGGQARMQLPCLSILHAAWGGEQENRGAGAYAGAVEDANAGAYAGAVEGGPAAGNAPEGDARGPPSVDAPGSALVHSHDGVPVAITTDGIRFEPTHNQCKGRFRVLHHIYENSHDGVCGAAGNDERGGVGNAGGGASMDGGAASVPPIPKRPRSAQPAAVAGATAHGEPAKGVPAVAPDLLAEAMAGVFQDAEVAIKLAEMYKEVTMKRLDVAREVAAAGNAGVGHRP